jgi:reverse gyrase
MNAVARATKIMGRPKGKRTERDDASVKIDRGIVGMAKMIATRRKITVAQFLSESLRPIVEREFTREMERLKGGEK